MTHSNREGFMFKGHKFAVTCVLSLAVLTWFAPTGINAQSSDEKTGSTPVFDSDAERKAAADARELDVFFTASGRAWLRAVEKGVLKLPTWLPSQDGNTRS